MLFGDGCMNFNIFFLKIEKKNKNSLFGHFSCSEWENTGQGKRIFWHVLHCVTVKSQEECKSKLMVNYKPSKRKPYQYDSWVSTQIQDV